MNHQELEDMSWDELKQLSTDLDLQFEGPPSKEKIIEAYKAHEAAQVPQPPHAEGDPPPPPGEDTPPPPTGDDPEKSVQPDPDDEPEPVEKAAKPVKVIHFVNDGFTALGKVWYRGEEIHFSDGDLERTRDSNGDTWTDLTKKAQEKRYGEVKFEKGPWPYDADGNAINDDGE